MEIEVIPIISRAQFIEAIKKRPYVLRNCCLCDYPLRYLYIDNVLHYDSGCDCVTYINIQPRDEHDLDFYLDPKHGYIDDINKFIEEGEAVTLNQPLNT